MKYRNWNDHQKSFIIECVQKNPTNISQGIREASLKLNRSAAAIRQLYYNELRFNSPILNIVSSSGKVYDSNVKNTPVKNKTYEEVLSNYEKIINSLTLEQLRDIILSEYKGGKNTAATV